MTREQQVDVLSIHDLASARLRNPPLDQRVEHDLREIVRITEKLLAPTESNGPDKKEGNG